MPRCCGRVGDLFAFLTTDPQTVGAITWAGLVVTLAGFWIAIAQLRKVKTSSMAAAEAVANLTNVVKSQEQNAKISSALVHLTSAQAAMKRGNADVAGAHLFSGWVALVAAREMAARESDRELISEFVLSTRQLYDDIDTPAFGRSITADAKAQRYAEISKTIEKLVIFSAQHDAAILGIGPSS